MSENSNFGIKFHKKYKTPYKSFDRMVLIRKLQPYGIRFDDLIVQGKKVKVIEICTTSKDNPNLKPKVKQLQGYLERLEPILFKLGYQLCEPHYLEVYEQDTMELIQRVEVYEHV